MQNNKNSLTQSLFGDLTWQTILSRVVAYIALTFFGFLMIFPFLYMLFTSFKTSDDVFRYPPALLPYSQENTQLSEENLSELNLDAEAGEELPLYEFVIDGEEVELVSTGENTRFGFFATQEQINVDEPRSSDLTAELPLDETVETGEIIILQNSAGDDEEFDVYEATIDGETVELLLAYRGSKTLFISPDNPEIQTFAVERTATPVEYVDFQLENYGAFFDLNLDRSLVNTSLVTTLVVVGQLVTSIFGGYAFSRVQFRGRDTLFLAYLGSIMIPFVVLIIPIYRLMVILDWQGQIVSLIVPWIFTAYGTFLMRQFFISIPKEIEEAALLDGASRFRVLWQIW